MKRTLIIFVACILLGTFFFLPFMPSDRVFMTKSQKERNIAFCSTGMCGLISYYTPFQYIKWSLRNIFASEPNLNETMVPLKKGEIPQLPVSSR